MSFRAGFARLLAAVSFAWAALSLLPMPTYALWYVHVVALETSLAASASAALALVIAPRATEKMSRALLLALLSGLAGLLPLLTTWPLYAQAGRSFSLLEYLGRWRAPPVQVQRDVQLAAESTLLADLYRAPGDGPHPYVLVIHGGSWRGGDKGDVAHVSWALAAAGYTVADVQYRLAPQHPFPNAIADVKCLAGKLRERALEFAIDPERGAYLGRSAGGQIALTAAYAAGDPRLAPACAVDDHTPQAVVSLYAPSDLAWGHAHPSRPDVARGPESLELYLEGPPNRRVEAYRLASPLTWADRPLPPTLLIHGTGDRIVSAEHARRLAAGLSSRGRPVRLMLIPLAEHGFDFRMGGVGEQLARANLLGFLREVLGPSSAERSSS